MATTTASAPTVKALLPLKEAAEICGVSYLKMREMAVERGQFTVSRDGRGRGFKVKIRRDECEVYAGLNDRFPGGGLESVKKFRRMKARD